VTKKRAFLFVVGLITSFCILEGSIRVASTYLGPPIISWNTMEDAKKLKLEEFRAKYKSPKYVLMGNSTTLIGFNPTIFDSVAGLPAGSSFNAAMNGSDIKTMRDFACGYIISKINPKTLVLLFSKTEMIQIQDYKELDSVSENVLFSSYLYKYRNTLRDPMTVNTILRILKYRDTRQGIVYRWADNLDDFGYTKYGTTSATFPEKGWNPRENSALDLSSYRVNKSQLKYLIEIRDFGQKHGVNLVIGTVPLLAQDLEYRGTLRAIADDLEIGFIQGNDAVGQGKYFQDEIHLNKDGAKIFSEFLAKELLPLVDDL
jgi:hypothetical protein